MWNEIPNEFHAWSNISNCNATENLFKNQQISVWSIFYVNRIQKLSTLLFNGRQTSQELLCHRFIFVQCKPVIFFSLCSKQNWIWLVLWNSLRFEMFSDLKEDMKQMERLRFKVASNFGWAVNYLGFWFVFTNRLRVYFKIVCDSIFHLKKRYFIFQI